MIILLIIYMLDGPMSANLSNTEESRRQPMSAGLSNIGASKRRLGYQLHKIGYTLCGTVAVLTLALPGRCVGRGACIMHIELGPFYSSSIENGAIDQNMRRDHTRGRREATYYH